MSLQKVLSSSTKLQVLRVLSDGKRALSPQELERETTKNISVIYDTVRKLHEENILTSIKEGKKNYYRLNRENKIAGQLVNLFKAESKEYGLEELPPHLANLVFEVTDELGRNVDGIQAAILFGSVARGDFTPESDVDLYIVLEESNLEKEDQIYDVIEQFDREFSIITRDVEGYSSDFGKEASNLGRSILLEGYAVLLNKMEKEKDSENYPI
jgi:predicted nucleotidyltransferase